MGVLYFLDNRIFMKDENVETFRIIPVLSPDKKKKKQITCVLRSLQKGKIASNYIVNISVLKGAILFDKTGISQAERRLQRMMVNELVFGRFLVSHISPM